MGETNVLNGRAFTHPGANRVSGTVSATIRKAPCTVIALGSSFWVLGGSDLMGKLMFREAHKAVGGNTYHVPGSPKPHDPRIMRASYGWVEELG